MLDSQAGIYDKAQIRYELDAGKLNVPLSVAHIEGQLVSYEQMPTLPRQAIDGAAGGGLSASGEDAGHGTGPCDDRIAHPPAALRPPWASSLAAYPG